MKDYLVLSSGKNKSIFFIGLEAKKTGSNPFAFTTFPKWIVAANLMTQLITH